MDSSWERLRAPEFWRWVFEGERAFDDEVTFDLELRAVDGRGFKVRVDEGTSLTLSDLGSGVELGWIDDAHFHPNCLRPTEPLHVARLQKTPDLQHLATLLLLPFSVISRC